MSSYTRVLRREYTGNLCLKTTDHCRTASLLTPKFTPKSPVIKQSKTFNDGQFLLELDNVLSSKECLKIIQKADKYIFENVSDKYRFGKQRNSSRLLALDEKLTGDLWDSLKSVLSKEMERQEVSTQPLGFDVTRGEWELHSLNEAVRVNKYSGKTKGYFGAHKDAQFCPNGDKRSIMTLLIYLSEDFKGGETCFYFPKDSTKSTKGMTIKEELDLHGGLEKGFEQVKIVPKVGHAVLSSQNVLHEAFPVTEGTKYILKTDVVVKRHSKEFGFAIEEREREDYTTCVNYFRRAQQQELEKNFDVASDLYEKALSIRYCYPSCMSEVPTVIDTSGYTRLPLELWLHIFKFLSGYDAQNLVYAYPELHVTLATLEQMRRKASLSLSNKKYVPKIRYQSGTTTSFEFSDAEHFRKNVTGCCRVAAMYSFCLLSHSPRDDVYTVKYNPDTQDVSIVSMETLLTDVFYGQRCYGSLYNVRQQDRRTRDPKKDFEASVDRNYMLMKHEAEFTGIELPDSFYTKSTVQPLFGCESSSDDSCYSDDSNESSDDDDDSDRGGSDDDDDDHPNDDDIDRGGNDCGDDHPNDADHDDIDRDCNNDGSDDDHDDKDIHRNGNDDGGDDDYSDANNDRDGNDVSDVDDRPGYDNRITYFGKGGTLSVDSVVRYFLLQKDTDDDNWSANNVNLKEQDSAIRYFREIEEGTKSATLVSKLITPLRVHRRQSCICFVKEDRNMSSSFSTECFNHLVFDFKDSQLTVTFANDEKHFYRSIKDEMAQLDCAGEVIKCEVDIKPLLKTASVSFNHAGCQCSSPRFDVHEYYNLERFYHLTSVAVFAKEMSGKMIVWTVYNGVVAL